MLDRSKALYRAADMIASFGRASMYSASSLAHESCRRGSMSSHWSLAIALKREMQLTLNFIVVYKTATGGSNFRSRWLSDPHCWLSTQFHLPAFRMQWGANLTELCSCLYISFIKSKQKIA